MKKFLISLSFTLVLPLSCLAAELKCSELPDCEALGYYVGTDSACGNNDANYIKCPYDQNYKKCVNYDCAEIGFTASNKSEWCAEIIKCKHNPDLTLCARRK